MVFTCNDETYGTAVTIHVTWMCPPNITRAPHQRVQRGEVVERELSNEQVSELIEQKLVAAEEAMERDSKHARRQSWGLQ